MYYRVSLNEVFIDDTVDRDYNSSGKGIRYEKYVFDRWIEQ